MNCLLHQVFEHNTTELFVASPTTAAATTITKINLTIGSVSYWLLLRVLTDTTGSRKLNNARKEKKKVEN